MLPTVVFEVQRAALWALQSDSNDGDEGDLFIILLIGFAVGCYLIYDGFDTWQLKRLVEDTPTSKVRSMPVGRVELEGTARKHEASVTPPLSDGECVYVDWEAEKRERRVDDDGDVHYVWKTIDDGEQALAFELEDDTGSVLIRADLDDPTFDINQDGHSRSDTYHSGERAPEDVRRWVRSGGDPDAASIESDDEEDGFLDDAMDFAKDLATDSLDDTGNRRRYSETVMPVDSQAYVFGSAEPREAGTMESSQADLLEVRRHSGTDEFLISDSSEDALESSYGKWAPIKLIAGLGLSAVCLFFLLAEFGIHEALL